MDGNDGLEIQNHPNHRKRPWWVVRILDEEEGFGEVLSTHVSEDGAKRKLRRIRGEYDRRTDSEYPGSEELDPVAVDKSEDDHDIEPTSVVD